MPLAPADRWRPSSHVGTTAAILNQNNQNGCSEQPNITTNPKESGGLTFVRVGMGPNNVRSVRIIHQVNVVKDLDLTCSSNLCCITFASDMDYGIVRMGLQVLGNIPLPGKEHQHAVWHQFFPLEFAKIARVRRRDTCDPLCMYLEILQGLLSLSRKLSLAGLPTGSADTDVLGYSLTILRDICACDCVMALIRKATNQVQNPEAEHTYSPKLCPYKGFRKDLVAVIVRNLLEGNVENQRVVSELELQGSVNVPEIAGLGLRVEVDEKTRRAKLINVS
ncbi:hypothetical protein RJ639_047819 [Escallonia herrerae]|uniref:Ataxin-10 domain-containing protein n=1 Tax=Escallonia herrerae TaxID=1293975 RepID=A0AA88W3B6_9ASTE|nr:hypothetical protein RJ639_047819 [Escallonia herrerae]